MWETLNRFRFFNSLLKSFGWSFSFSRFDDLWRTISVRDFFIGKICWIELNFDYIVSETMNRSQRKTLLFQEDEKWNIRFYDHCLLISLQVCSSSSHFHSMEREFNPIFHDIAWLLCLVWQHISFMRRERIDDNVNNISSFCYHAREKDIGETLWWW